MASAPTVGEYLGLQHALMISHKPPVDTGRSVTYGQGVIAQTVMGIEFQPEIHTGPPALRFNAERHYQIEIGQARTTTRSLMMGHRPTMRMDIPR
jgi:hypothetical protein